MPPDVNITKKSAIKGCAVVPLLAHAFSDGSYLQTPLKLLSFTSIPLPGAVSFSYSGDSDPEMRVQGL